MDNLTHTLIGVAVANAGPRQKFGRGAVLALAIGSNITDLDVLWGFVNPDPSFAYRRMLTHAVFGVPILAALAAAAHRRFFPHVSFRNWFLLYLLGTALHVFFDLCNSYGVVLFYPFSRSRYELAWLFIIDLALWFFLLAPLLLSRLRSRWTRVEDLSRVALRSVLLYVAACALLHHRSELALRRYVSDAQIRPSFSYVFPEALGPHRFRGVVREGDLYRIYRIDAIGGGIREFRTSPTDDRSPDVARILASREGRLIDWFAKAPVWVRGESGTPGTRRWLAWDLRFESTVIDRGNPFRYGFDVTDEAVTFLGRVPVPEGSR